MSSSWYPAVKPQPLPDFTTRSWGLRLSSSPEKKAQCAHAYKVWHQGIRLRYPQIEFIEVPFPEVPAAVEAGRIDAGYGAEPFITTVLDQGGEVVYAPQSELAPEYPNGSYAASQQFIADNGDVIESFTQAMNRSVEYARDNEDAVREIIPTYTEIDPEVAERMRLPVFTSELDEQAIDEQMGFLEEYDIVEAAPTAGELICG
jgi:NitT/TauT family transport system substrate-binding protein